MATFTVTIRTSARSKPATRNEDIHERGRLQQCLLQVASAVSACGRYEGTVAGAGVSAEFDYSIDGDAA